MLHEELVSELQKHKTNSVLLVERDRGLRNWLRQLRGLASLKSARQTGRLKMDQRVDAAFLKLKSVEEKLLLSWETSVF